MQQACGALPVLEGKARALRAFMSELGTPARAKEFEASERRLGITKESWYLQGADSHPSLLVYLESPDLGKAFTRFAESTDGFDAWFKKNMIELTGVDFNVPPTAPMSEQLSSYAG
jgi:hypothetical protein